MMNIEKDVKVLAAISALLVVCLILIFFAPFAAGDEDTDTDTEPEENETSLFLIVPADYRTIFQYGNPILFGIAIDNENTGLTYHSGSGLTGIVMINLTPGTYIIHADAPDVDEPTTFILTLDAHYNDGLTEYSESYDVVIKVGDYNIGIIPEPEIIEEPEPEPEPEPEQDNSAFYILLAVAVAFAIVILAFVSSNNRIFAVIISIATLLALIAIIANLTNYGGLL